MDLQLIDKVVIITGGAKGIGAAITKSVGSRRCDPGDRRPRSTRTRQTLCGTATGTGPQPPRDRRSSTSRSLRVFRIPVQALHITGQHMHVNGGHLHLDRALT